MFDDLSTGDFFHWADNQDKDPAICVKTGIASWVVVRSSVFNYVGRRHENSTSGYVPVVLMDATFKRRKDENNS